MYILPSVTSTQEAMEFMGALHHNLSWLVVLFEMIAISTGFIELRHTTRASRKERVPNRPVTLPTGGT
jgi:hypothetical protein